MTAEQVEAWVAAQLEATPGRVSEQTTRRVLAVLADEMNEEMVA